MDTDGALYVADNGRVSWKVVEAVQTIRDLTATSRDENRQLAMSGGGICNID